MKVEIKKTKENGTIQITTIDERWYYREKDEKIVPSSTWISGYYPKGTPFYKWLAEKGWDEAEAIKSAAGDKGSKVHRAIELLLTGNTINMDDAIAANDGPVTELTKEEWECLMAFCSWFNEMKPEVIATEQVVWNEDVGYAGTLDFLCKIDGVVFLVDFKTSQNLWPEHELQLSSYKHALVEQPEKMAVLQIGYRRNKKGWKFTEIEDKFDLFLAAKQIWWNENKNVTPKTKDYPPSLSLI
jgi:hypothetical protein